jgi:hypothetical protein
MALYYARNCGAGSQPGCPLGPASQAATSAARLRLAARLAAKIGCPTAWTLDLFGRLEKVAWPARRLAASKGPGPRGRPRYSRHRYWPP